MALVKNPQAECPCTKCGGVFYLNVTVSQPAREQLNERVIPYESLSKMIRAIRYHIGRLMIWYGYRILPPGVRGGVQAIIRVGYEWGKENETTIDRIIAEDRARH